MARQVIYDQADGATGVLSTIDGILQEDYVVKNIVNTVNMSTYFLSQLRSERTTSGRRFVIPLQFGVGEGQGSRGENEALPDEGWGEYDQAMGNVRYQYGSLFITGQSIAATEGGGKAAFASALKQALKDVRDGFKLESHRQSWGDGSGTIGRVNGAVNASTTVPVDDPYGLTYVSASLSNSQKTRPYRRNMNLYFVTSAEVRKVTAVNGDGTLTVDAAVTLVDNELIIRGDAVGQTSLNKEIQGVSAGVQSTGTYLTIARAGLPEWQSNLIDQNSVALDEDALQAAFDTAEINGTDEPDLLIAEHEVRRIYVSLLQTYKRIVNPMQLEGGFSAIEYNGKPLVVDKRCPPQRLYYLRMADWAWYVMEGIGWLNRDGTVLKWVSQKDAYRAILKAYRTMAVQKPANQTVIYNITQ